MIFSCIKLGAPKKCEHKATARARYFYRLDAFPVTEPTVFNRTDKFTLNAGKPVKKHQQSQHNFTVTHADKLDCMH